MDNLKTPDSIIAELVSIRAEAQKGVTAQYEAEVKLARLTLDAELAEAKALLGAQGTVQERNALAKMHSSSQRLDADIAKAEFNRVKSKMKVLEMSQMSVQTQARLVELMYKSAGHGER